MGFLFVGCFLDLDMVRYISLLLFIGLAWGQGGGYALDFDGSNDFVEIQEDNTLDITNNITVEAWVYYQNLTRGEICVKNLNWEYGIMDGYLQPSIYTTTWYQPTDSRALNVNKWYHVAMVYDGTKIMNYINAVGENVQSLSGTMATSNQNAMFGKWYTDSEYLDGYLDEVRIWNDARTVAEIQEYMHKDLTGSESNLVAYYKMSNGTGTSLTDNSSNSNTGTLTNMDNADWVTSQAPIGDLGSSYETDVEGLWSMSGTSESDASTGLTLTVGSALSTGNFAVFGNNNTSGSSGSDIGSVASTERSGRIWQMDESGTVSATVKIDISDATGLSPSMGTASNYLLLYRSGTSGNFSSAASGASTSGDVVTFSSVSLQDGYYALGTHSDASLPVEISSFELLDVRDESMTLQWVTESELNNLGFILERRSALTDWLQIASYLTDSSLEGQGTVSHRTTYVYEDEGVEVDQVYDYRLADVDVHGNVEYHSLQLMGVSSSSNMPEQFLLYPNYPNPFNPVTTIRYDLPEDGNVSLVIHDVTGSVIRQLVKGRKEAGHHRLTWDGTNDQGRKVSAGIYLCSIRNINYFYARKIILVK